MYDTRIDIPADTRTDIVSLLQASLADAVDLFTEVSRAIDKQLWFVEAHLQSSD